MNKKNTPITASLIVIASIVLTMLLSIVPLFNQHEEVSEIKPTLELKKEKSVEFSVEEIIPSPNFSLKDLLQANIASNVVSREDPVPENEDTFAAAPVSNFVYTSEVVASSTTSESDILLAAAPPSDPTKISKVTVRQNTGDTPQFQFKPPPPTNKKLKNQEPPPDIIKSDPGEPEDLKEAAKEQDLTDTGVSLPLLVLLIVIIAFLAHTLPKRRIKN